MRAELAEARGLVSAYLNADPEVALDLGIGILQIGNAFGGRIRTIPISLLNRIVGLGIEQPATPDDLDLLAAHYEGVEWAIELPPMAQVDHERLRERGLTIEAPHAKFVRRADDLPDAPEVEVRRIEHSELPTFAEVRLNGSTPTYHLREIYPFLPNQVIVLSPLQVPMARSERESASMSATQIVFAGEGSGV